MQAELRSLVPAVHAVIDRAHGEMDARAEQLIQEKVALSINSTTQILLLHSNQFHFILQHSILLHDACRLLARSICVVNFVASE